MLRIAKLKPEMAKIKVVFRLQFHATQIPQPGWDKLFVSFIPVDTGNTTAKTTKANVRNGNCKWSDPIYETAILFQDAKTKNFEEKLYKLVVALGSSRSSILGEATINLADFVDASKPLSAALPLQGDNLTPVLHITVQLLTSKTGFREFEQQRDVRERRFQMPTGPSVHDKSAKKVSSSAEAANDQIDKVHSIVRFKSDSMELSSLDGVLNEDYTDSAVGIDGTSQTSESLYAEKHDISSTHEVDSLKSIMLSDLVGFSPSQGPQSEKGDLCESRLVVQASSDWVHGWSSDYSMDFNQSAAFQENSRLRVNLEIAEASIQELKLEVSSLQCLADQLGTEAQRFSQQLASEIASGQDLAREFFILKSESTKFKDDYRQHIWSEQLLPKLGQKGLHEHAYHLDGSTVMRERITKLFNELEKSKVESEGLVSKMNQMEIYYESLIQELEVGQIQMIDELQNLRSEHSTCLYTICTFETQMEKLRLDINEQLLRFSKEKQDLDALNKELEKRAVSSDAALKRLRWNYSFAADHLQKDLELLSFQVLSMFETHENLARQAFSEASQLCLQEYLQEDKERQNLTEQFAGKVGGIQLEIELSRKNVLELSSNVDGALTHPEDILKSRLHCQELDVAEPIDKLLNEKPVKKLTGRSFPSHDELLVELDAVLSGVYVQNAHLGVYSDILEEALHESSGKIKLLKQKIDCLEQQLKHEDDSRGLLTLKLQSALHEIEVLRDSEVKYISRCNDLKSENHVLEADLQSTSAENSHLTQKLAECEGVISECRSYESNYHVCTDEKDKLEKMLQQNSLERSCLQNELTTVYGELKMLKAKYDEQSSVKDYLEKTLDFLEDKLGALMSRMVSYLEQIDPPLLANNYSQSEMQSMNLITITKLLEEVQHRAFEHILQVNNEKKDTEEQRDIARGSLSRVESQLWLLKGKFESQIADLQMKLNASNLNSEKLLLELQAIEDKLRTSTDAEVRQVVENRELVLKLAELETNLQLLTNEKEILTQKMWALESVNGDVTDNLKRSIETEDSYVVKNRELSLKLAELETKLHVLAYENSDFARRMHTFGAVREELEKTTLAFSHYAEESKALIESLQEGNEESVQLTNELTGLKERLRCTEDELQAEKGHIDSLEAMVRDRTLQLNKNREELLSLECQKAEFVHLEQHVSGLETENTKLKDSLLKCKDSRVKAVEDSSFLQLHVEELESSLQSMHECSLAADIEVVFTKIQFQAGMQQLHNQLRSSERCNQELHLKHLDVVTTLNKCMGSEAQYKEENAKLLVALESLKSELDAFASLRSKRDLEGGRTPSALVEEYD
ncbi:intracellular protein transport protein USO1-like [Aristolochia californica]|uniref:intracellular protein transport protein USO1-like n=1 Tax=Aristolochia californica TaxID=171875 RepID=UPI0035E04761